MTVATCLTTFLEASATAAPPAVEPVAITSRAIRAFKIGSEATRFGPLEFIGGLELTGSSPDFGSLSAFRFLLPGKNFIGVADTGFWFFGSIARDAQGRPAGVEKFTMQRMVDASGEADESKWNTDAEGLGIRDGKAIVGLERRHRIAEYAIDPADMKPAGKTYNFLVPKAELRINRGFETVTFAHPQGIHAGGLVVVSEKSLDKAGNIFAAILEGPDKGVFTVKRNGDFDITDGAFLPDGDLLLLERRYSMLGGVGMRLRRIYGESVRKGAVADGPVLFEADMGYQIDNMEGLDVWRREDGATMVSLISDDNQSILQRSLYLEFRLVAE